MILFVFMSIFYQYDNCLIKRLLILLFVFTAINTFIINDVKKYFVYSNYFTNCKNISWKTKIKNHDILWTKKIDFKKYENICDDILNEKK